MSIIDTPYDTTRKANALADAGVQTVFRYYNFSNSSTFPDKCLVLDEARALTAAGLQIGVVFQQRQNQMADFSRAKGIAAGVRAYRYARDEIGQPSGSGIYFSVDFDATQTQIVSAIQPFFEGIKTGMQAQGDGRTRYRIGIYGSGLVTSTLARLGLAELAWLAMSRGFRGTREALAAGKYHLAQIPPEAKLTGLDVDYNEANPREPDFGAFTLEAVRKPTPLVQEAQPPTQRYRVTARNGLRLRSGPGIGFEAIGGLAAGQHVWVVDIKDGWAQVGLSGNGRVGGFASASFLARV